MTTDVDEPSRTGLVLSLFAVAFIVSANIEGNCMKYGFGWRPNVLKHEGDLPESRFASAAPLPARFDRLSAYVGGGFVGAEPNALAMLNHGTSSRCVAFSFAEVCYGRLSEQGETPKLIDIHAAYVLAQREMQERAGQGRKPLEDAGLYPVDLLDATGKYGVRPCLGPSDPILDPARVNEDVWADDVREAATHLVTAWRRIPDSDPDPVTAAKRALFAGFPGFDGMSLANSFQDYKGGVYVRRAGYASIGGHATSTWGWDDTAVCPDGTRGALLKLNHWGDTWGMAGWFWLSYSTYRSQFVSDRTFLELAPKL